MLLMYTFQRWEGGGNYLLAWGGRELSWQLCGGRHRGEDGTSQVQNK